MLRLNPDLIQKHNFDWLRAQRAAIIGELLASGLGLNSPAEGDVELPSRPMPTKNKIAKDDSSENNK